VRARRFFKASLDLLVVRILSLGALQRVDGFAVAFQLVEE
jgi:hypothetical protein